MAGRARTKALATKFCRRCDQRIAVSDFSPSAASGDGLFSWCRRCVATAQGARLVEVRQATQVVVGYLTEQLETLPLHVRKALVRLAGIGARVPSAGRAARREMRDRACA